MAAPDTQVLPDDVPPSWPDVVTGRAAAQVYNRPSGGDFPAEEPVPEQPVPEEPARTDCSAVMPAGQWTMISRRETPHGLMFDYGKAFCEGVDVECSASASKQYERPMDLLFLLDDCTYLRLSNLRPVEEDMMAAMVAGERRLQATRYYDDPNYAGDLCVLEKSVIVETDTEEIYRCDQPGDQPLYLWIIAEGLHVGLGGGNAAQRLFSYNLPSPDCAAAMRLGTTRCDAGSVWYRYQ